MSYARDPEQDIGHGVLIQVFRMDGEIDGIGGSHPTPSGGICSFWIPVGHERTSHVWQLDSEDRWQRVEDVLQASGRLDTFETLMAIAMSSAGVG